MTINLLAVGSGRQTLADVSRALFLKGFDVNVGLTVFDAENAYSTLETVSVGADVVVVTGESEVLRSKFCEEYDFGSENVVDIDGTVYAFVPDGDNTFVAKTLIPTLNSMVSTYHDSFIIKTFSKTAAQLKEKLKEVVKNRNKIVFRFFESVGECDVCIRYSSKMTKSTVDAIISRAVELTKDCAYAHTDISLNEAVANALMEKGLTLSIAESFTGGAVASKLISIAGVSSVLKESVVAYSNESKMRRLTVKKDTLDTHGAVSVETAYEMAANALMQSDSDLALATTGNAGPSAEKDGDNGLFYIAAGSREGIFIYRYKVDGDRETVTQYGVKAGLFRLLNIIKGLPPPNKAE